jgi:hypothetical protein
VKYPRFPAVERHCPGFTLTIDFNIEALRQSIHNGRADTVKTSGGGVRTSAKLSTGMKFRKDQFDTGETGAGLDIDGDAAAQVGNRHAAIGVEGNRDV